MAIRGSSVLATASAMLFLILLQLQYEAIHSAKRPKTYIVGDDGGWTPGVNMTLWAKGKHFHVGDILEFKYSYQFELNVAAVDKKGYDTCTVKKGDYLVDTQDDLIPLHIGGNYFIPTDHNLCAAGMKLAVNATARPPSSI